VKNFRSLAKNNRGLYQKAISLPFISRKEKFEDYVKELKKSKDLKKNEKKYLDNLLIRKNRWAKCLMKGIFGGGISTTSRVEGLHAVLKKYLTSRSSLQNVFYAFREIEEIQLIKFQDEFNLRSKNVNPSQIDFIQKLKPTLPEYAVKIFFQST